MMNTFVADAIKTAKRGKDVFVNVYKGNLIIVEEKTENTVYTISRNTKLDYTSDEDIKKTDTEIKKAARNF